MATEILKAGELDTPIDIYNNITSQNEYGELITSTAFQKTIWAKLVTTGTKGNEKVQDDTIRAENKINFLVRYDSGLLMNSSSISPEQLWSVKYEEKMWNISSMEVLGRGKGIMIRCDYTDNTLS